MKSGRQTGEEVQTMVDKKAGEEVQPKSGRQTEEVQTMVDRKTEEEARMHLEKVQNLAENQRISAPVALDTCDDMPL